MSGHLYNPNEKMKELTPETIERLKKVILNTATSMLAEIPSDRVTDLDGILIELMRRPDGVPCGCSACQSASADMQAMAADYMIRVGSVSRPDIVRHDYIKGMTDMYKKMMEPKE